MHAVVVVHKAITNQEKGFGVVREGHYYGWLLMCISASSDNSKQYLQKYVSHNHIIFNGKVGNIKGEILQITVAFCRVVVIKI
jgi:hypothetical protein